MILHHGIISLNYSSNVSGLSLFSSSLGNEKDTTNLNKSKEVERKFF